MVASNDPLRETSPLYSGNAAFLEDLYERYSQDPGSIPADWRRYFDAWRNEGDGLGRAPVRRDSQPAGPEKDPLSHSGAEKQAAVLRYINAHRVRGHQNARLDPINLRGFVPVPDLDLAYHNLGEADMDTVFNTGSLHATSRMTLREIAAFVSDIYLGPLGAEYMHITDTKEKRWIQEGVEGRRDTFKIDPEGKRWLLTLLTAAEGIEKYLHTRYVGQKRFSLEGAEALIPLLDELIQHGGAQGIEEMVIGMAHRGRLNVLTNILGKPPEEIFNEFEGRRPSNSQMSSGDVKYHMGFSTDIETPGGIVHVALGFNPSHLEIIDPVVEGSVRARQHRRGDHTGGKVLPVLIHGDAAFAGQGVVMETLNLSQARGFSTGGTLHIIVNNRIGFTTSDPLDARSTVNCTDVAKMVQAPIFHVNGDNPEALIFATRLALDFRLRFRKDVILDLICYRRHGHNEADEPAVTQPRMYRKIRGHTPVRALYADRLISQGILDPETAQRMVEEYRLSIEQGRVIARPVLCGLKSLFSVNWKRYCGIPWDQPARTGFDRKRLTGLALKQLEIPPGFELHPRVEHILRDRRKMAQGDVAADWGFAENLAYATLLDEGYPIRLSGQDGGRGTFFHRHAVLHNQADGESYSPLQHLSEGQPDFLVIDSTLSEEAVMGFEYGYASAEPNALTLWEAQFGDFANGAQVVIDQFITSAGAKWGMYCGLVLLLPHGYEGQGPEHSSARLERYLQLCAEENIQVCVPSTPAQIFHLLRRQMIRPYRHPLVVMTPKSLLRHKLATSSMDELSDGRFHPVLGEIDAIPAHSVKRVILCAGKLYYELLEARRSGDIQDVAILRIEQLYPFPRTEFLDIIEAYRSTPSLVWCQEEPQNQGAWDYIRRHLKADLGDRQQLHYIGRPAAAAPAAGSHKAHMQEQQGLIEAAISGAIEPNPNQRLSG